MPEGATATDLVLTVTQMLRKKGVVGKFVEFYGDGVGALSLADRATIANMAPEYGATIGVFPIDNASLDYLRMTNRAPEQIELVEAYAREQGLFRIDGAPDPVYSDTLGLDLSTVVPSLAGPKRPQDRINLPDVKKNFLDSLGAAPKTNGIVQDGSVVIAAITSCTNTSNPSVLVAAGLLAKKAVERGLKSKPWVKTSLAPGSKVVIDYLADAGLLPYLEELKFHLVGYGCTTCIGNSGPLPDDVAAAVTKEKLTVAAVLSGNRNFEGRVNPLVRANYLASPPLVVAYALAGRVDMDLANESLGEGKDGKAVYLRDIWPTDQEVQAAVKKSVKREMFAKQYSQVFEGDAQWKAIKVPAGDRYQWDESSTYIKRAPYFDDLVNPATHVKDFSGVQGAGGAGRFHHHGSHFARRQHRQRQPGRAVPDFAGREAGRLQLLRRAARQSRSHGARDAGQHPPAEPDGSGNRRRLDHARAFQRADVHLRCLGEVSEGRRAAADHRGEGIRIGFVARLGGEGRSAAGRQSGDRRELRAHSSLEPGGHGRAAARVPGRAESRVAGLDGIRNVLDRRSSGGGRFVREVAREGDGRRQKTFERRPASIRRWKRSIIATAEFCRSC